MARTSPPLSLGARETEEGIGLWGAAGAAGQQRECWDLSSWGWGEAGAGDLGQEGQAELAPALPVWGPEEVGLHCSCCVTMDRSSALCLSVPFCACLPWLSRPRNCGPAWESPTLKALGWCLEGTQLGEP